MTAVFERVLPYFSCCFSAVDVFMGCLFAGVAGVLMFRINLYCFFKNASLLVKSTMPLSQKHPPFQRGKASRQLLQTLPKEQGFCPDLLNTSVFSSFSRKTDLDFFRFPEPLIALEVREEDHKQSKATWD